jgi:F-type H+-transporting ATPase subunit gamma
VCLRAELGGATPPVDTPRPSGPAARSPPIGALIFGSDQGLVGRFNEVIVDFALEKLRQLPGPKTIWAVGERVAPQLEPAHLTAHRQFTLPNSVPAITSLVTQIQIEMEEFTAREPAGAVYVFHNRPHVAPRYEPEAQLLLPLETSWRSRLTHLDWPNTPLPEILGGAPASLAALIHEYLFIALYKSCAESLASENASRLESMQRAERNIETVSTELHRLLNRLRQSSIDDELFDVVAGFNALSAAGPAQPGA